MNLNLNALIANPITAGAIGGALGYYVGGHRAMNAVIGALSGVLLAKMINPMNGNGNGNGTIPSLTNSSLSMSSGALTKGPTTAAATTPADAEALNPTMLGAAATLGQPVSGFAGYSTDSRSGYQPPLSYYGPGWEQATEN